MRMIPINDTDKLLLIEPKEVLDVNREEAEYSGQQTIEM